MHPLEMDGKFNLFNFFQLFDPALNLSGPGGLGPEPVDEFPGLLDLPLLLLVELEKLLFPLGLHPLVMAVVSGIPAHRPQRDLIHGIDGLIEEIAVVGDQQISPVIGGEKIHQPDAGLEIQIVRRLVKQEDVRCFQQDVSQGDTHLPPARELAAGSIQVID
jgi:hypothetical protein